MPSASEFDSMIASAESARGIPKGLLRALIEHESAFDPNCIGDSGLARGLCQMHPSACASVGANWDKMFDPASAISAGAAYLVLCWRLVGDWQWALAAYNQGPTVISRGLRYAQAVEALNAPR